MAFVAGSAEVAELMRTRVLCTVVSLPTCAALAEATRCVGKRGAEARTVVWTRVSHACRSTPPRIALALALNACAVLVAVLRARVFAT